MNGKKHTTAKKYNGDVILDGCLCWHGVTLGKKYINPAYAASQPTVSHIGPHRTKVEDSASSAANSRSSCKLQLIETSIIVRHGRGCNANGAPEGERLKGMTVDATQKSGKKIV